LHLFIVDELRSSSPTELLRSKSEGKEENEILFAFAKARVVDELRSSSPTELLRSKSEGKEENEILFAFAKARVVDELRSSSRRRDGRRNLFLRPSSPFANARVFKVKSALGLLKKFKFFA